MLHSTNLLVVINTHHLQHTGIHQQLVHSLIDHLLHLHNCLTYHQMLHRTLLILCLHQEHQTPNKLLRTISNPTDEYIDDEIYHHYNSNNYDNEETLDSNVTLPDTHPVIGNIDNQDISNMHSPTTPSSRLIFPPTKVGDNIHPL